MRPCVMERLGPGPDACHARNPRLVYGPMAGWGQDGPLAQAVGHEQLIQLNLLVLRALLPRHTAEPPSSAITVVTDVGGGALYLAVGVLSGILNAHRTAPHRTGKGTVVDAATVDGSAHMMQLLMSTSARDISAVPA